MTPKTDMAKLGAVIRHYRKLRGFTQKEVGAALNLSPSIIGMYEQGRRMPTLNNLVKLGAILDVDLIDIVSFDDFDDNNNPKFEEIDEPIQEYHGPIPHSSKKELFDAIINFVKSTPSMQDYFLDEFNSLNYDKNDYSYYDYAPVNISAGTLESVDPLNQFEKIKVPNIMLGKYASTPNILFMNVNGESMNRVIPNGALIGVYRNVPISSIHEGDIVVIFTDEGYSVKRYYKDEDNQRYIFKPDSTDPYYVPIVRGYDEPTILVGKVISYNVVLC